jgi:hypothetical protein
VKSYFGRYEVVLQNDKEIIPIEEKLGINLKAASFKFFCDKYKPQKAIRTSLTDYRKEEWMANLPLYAINTI